METEHAAAVNAGFGLPVPKDRRDPRLKHFKIPTLLVDPSMQTNPPGVPVASVGFNPKYTRVEAENRLGVATLGALIRAHETSNANIVGKDHAYSDVMTLLGSGQLPPEPDWEKYLKRLASKEALTMPIYALPEGVPADVGNLQWMTADIRKAPTFNYTADPGLIHEFYDINPTTPLDGWSIRVNNDGALQFDIYNNNTHDIHENKVNQQLLYDVAFIDTITQIFDCIIMTQGIVSSDGSPLFQYAFITSYDSLQKKNHYGSIFLDCTDLLFGAWDTKLGFNQGILRVSLIK